MATFSSKLYGKVYLALWNKEIDYDTDVITVLLTAVGYVPDQDVHDYLDDITNEVAGGGYSRQVLGSKTSTYTAGTNVHALDAADTAFSTFTATFRVVVVADTSPGSDAARPLILYQLADMDVVGAGGTFTLVWNASGLVAETVA